MLKNEEIFIRTVVQPVYIDNNKIVGKRGIVQNITEEKKLKELNRQVSELAHIGSWELDLIGEASDNMYWSPMVRDILEVNDDYNATFTGGFEFYSETSKQKIQEALQQLTSTGVGFDDEFLIKTAKQNDRWIRVIGDCVKVHDKIVKIYGSIQDIHDKKKQLLLN